MEPPLIIAGMHRSGTTLLVELLRSFGVFFGADLDPNLEDYFFLRRNEWLLRRAGGSWQHPRAVVDFLADESVFDEACELFRAHVNGRAFRRYLGRSPLLGSRSAPPSPWGWKDPRNVFTMGVWASVFPGAKLLYIRRNGVDVAASLRAREDQRKRVKRLQVRGVVERLRNAAQPIEFHDHYLYPAGPYTLAAGFELWQQYTERGEAAYAAHTGPKLALTFEQLVRAPEETAAELLAFVGLDADSSAADSRLADIRADRASAFEADPELRAFYLSVRDTHWMRTLGYSQSTPNACVQ